MRKGKYMPQMFRRVIACFIFVAMTFLFFASDDVVSTDLAWLPEWQIVPAVLSFNLLVLSVLVVVTLLFGRVYCSVICPLGIFQDIISRMSGLFGKKKRRFSYKEEKKLLRGAVFVLFLVLIVAGFHSWAMLIDPYSAYGRMAVNIVAPLARLFGVGEAYESLMRGIALDPLLVALLTLAVVTVSAWRGGRAYCNLICPVGTLLSFFARFALFRPIIDRTKCRCCGLCATQCKASCIDVKNGRVGMSRCVACMNCLSACQEGALTLRLFWKRKASPEEKTSRETQALKVTNASRRRFLRSSVRALGVSAVLSPVSADAFREEACETVKRRTAVVPVGAQGVREFFSRCTACQLCVVNCPQGVLRPSDDWQTFMQPTLSYEHGFCPPECNVCSQLCPTDAIQSVSEEGKSSVRVGYAVWDADRCLVLSEGHACGNCARRCPSGAIYMKRIDSNDPHSLRVPTVNTELCTGCGACEYFCLAAPSRAMYVEGRGKHVLVGEAAKDETLPKV